MRKTDAGKDALDEETFAAPGGRPGEGAFR